jgi:hypothetical protein
MILLDQPWEPTLFSRIHAVWERLSSIEKSPVTNETDEEMP